MSIGWWILTAGNAVAASILLFAAFAKLASPQILSRTLLRLTDRPAMSSREVVRAVGLVEAAAAFGLLVEPARRTAGLVLVLLGIAFVSLGVIGRIRKVDEPCGCFGAASQQPLGYQNIVLGALIGAAGAANLVASGQLSDDARAGAPLIAAGMLCVICLITNRSTMRSDTTVSS
ncbi:MAG: MauE/DoxX family redox-associated membrane protein [Jatrophihabitans sp.]